MGSQMPEKFCRQHVRAGCQLARLSSLIFSPLSPVPGARGAEPAAVKHGDTYLH